MGFVTLKVYDVLGREVATLVNEEKLPGHYVVSFDARSSNFGVLPSGVYFYQLFAAPLAPRDLLTTRREGQASSIAQTKKLLLLK